MQTILNVNRVQAGRRGNNDDLGLWDAQPIFASQGAVESKSQVKLHKKTTRLAESNVMGSQSIPKLTRNKLNQVYDRQGAISTSNDRFKGKNS